MTPPACHLRLLITFLPPDCSTVTSSAAPVALPFLSPMRKHLSICSPSKLNPRRQAVALILGCLDALRFARG